MAKNYPRWRYHKTFDARIVQSEAEDIALGEGWEDSYGAFMNVAEAPQIEEVPKAHSESFPEMAPPHEEIEAEEAPKPKSSYKRKR